MIWKTVTEDTSIPDWLKENLRSNCYYCGQPMLAGHNEFGRITGLRCSDMSCPSMIASRVEFVFELLGIKGYGFAKAYELVRMKKWKSPVQYLQILDKKPIMPLGVYLRCNCIQGIDGEWETLALQGDCYTLDEMFATYPDNKFLQDNKDMLISNLEYVELLQRTRPKVRSAVNITIMITGTPIGYPTKSAFVNACNEFCEGEFRIIHQETKRQTGVDFLIQEPGSTTRGKVEAAKKGNIPIVTSATFMQYLALLMEEVRKT